MLVIPLLLRGDLPGTGRPWGHSPQVPAGISCAAGAGRPRRTNRSAEEAGFSLAARFKLASADSFFESVEEGWFHYLWRSAVNPGVSATASAFSTLRLRPRVFITVNHPSTRLSLGLGGTAGYQDSSTLGGCGEGAGHRRGRLGRQGRGSRWAGATAASAKARESPWREITGETLAGPQSLAPLPRKSPMEGRGQNTGKKREETTKEFSAKRALKILIQDEMCSCLCTTHLPPKWRALSITGVFQ